VPIRFGKPKRPDSETTLPERQVVDPGLAAAPMGRAQRSEEVLVGHHVRVLGLPVRLDPRPATTPEDLRALGALAGPFAAPGDALAARWALQRAPRTVGATKRLPEALVGRRRAVPGAPVADDTLPAGAEDPTAQRAPTTAALGHAFLACKTGLGHDSARFRPKSTRCSRRRRTGCHRPGGPPGRGGRPHRVPR